MKLVDPNNEEEAAQAGINKVELGQGVTYSQYLQVGREAQDFMDFVASWEIE